ncbi:unnamed protein product, partial [Heterotrigona itama]
ARTYVHVCNDNADYATNNTHIHAHTVAHTGHFHGIYLQIFRSNVGWNMYLKNKRTINSACISFAFV